MEGTWGSYHRAERSHVLARAERDKPQRAVRLRPSRAVRKALSQHNPRMKNTLVVAWNGTIITVSLIPIRTIPIQDIKHDVASAFFAVRMHANDKATPPAQRKTKKSAPTTPTFNRISSRPLCAWGTNQ